MKHPITMKVDTDSPFADFGLIYDLYDADGTYLGCLNSQETALEIVAAVNSREKLVEALKWAEKLDSEHKDNQPFPDLGLRAMYRQRWREARDAFKALSEGGAQ